MAPGRKKSATAARNWEIGDLVLAKVRGYPAWPAKVSAPEKHKLSPRPSKVFVEYFGTKDFGFVQSGEISEFTPDVRSLILKKAKNTVNGRLHNCFRVAVNEICKLSDRLQKSGSGIDEVEAGAESLARKKEGKDEGGSDASDCGEVVDEKYTAEDELVRHDPMMDSFACLAMAAEAAACENESEEGDEAAAAAVVLLAVEQLDEKRRVVKTFERRKKTISKGSEAKEIAAGIQAQKSEAGGEAGAEAQEIEAGGVEVKQSEAGGVEVKQSEAGVEAQESKADGEAKENEAGGVEAKEIEAAKESEAGVEAKDSDARVLKTFERKKKLEPEPEPEQRPKAGVKTEPEIRASIQKPAEKQTEKKTFKRDLSRKVSEPDPKKLRPNGSGEAGVVAKKRGRKEDPLPPPPKRSRPTKSPAKAERENKEKAKPKVAPPPPPPPVAMRDVKVISPVTIVAAPTRLMEAETNKVREAYEAAKEMRQRLAQKEESVSASMKFLQAAAQAKRMHSGSNPDSAAMFMRAPEKPSPSHQQHQLHHHHSNNSNTGEKPGVAFYSRKEGTLESFQSALETLTGTQEGILKVTRYAMRCASKGYEKKVMQMVMRKLQNEGEHRKRIDLLFLVESMTRGSNGAGYARIAEAWLGRLLTAVAPPNSPLENHKQCLKVVRIWHKRQCMQESLLNDIIARIEAGLNTRKRQHQREDRAVDDPVREIDDMLVDEYGSNAGFQLPGLLARRVDEDEDEHQHQQEQVQQQQQQLQPASRLPASSPENNRRAVIMEDLDGELEMEDVSPLRNEATRAAFGHDQAEVEEDVPLPASSPPPLPESPPPSSPPRPPNSPSPHSSLLQQQQQQHHHHQ